MVSSWLGVLLLYGLLSLPGTVRYGSHVAGAASCRSGLNTRGANGAFGAGFLNGSTKTGKRPVFKIVTGISTGALMAPFAFLGPAYDDALRESCTTTASRNVQEE